MSIKRNILTIKKIHREVGRAKDLSALMWVNIYMHLSFSRFYWAMVYGISSFTWM